jgi:hypothetical protein
VATILIAQMTRPIYSAPVNPNPIITPSTASPDLSDSHHSTNESDHNNNTQTLPTINSHTNYHHLDIHDELEPLPTTITVNNIIQNNNTLNEHQNPNPRQHKQYLISQFCTNTNPIIPRRPPQQTQANTNNHLYVNTITPIIQENNHVFLQSESNITNDIPQIPQGTKNGTSKDIFSRNL